MLSIRQYTNSQQALSGNKTMFWGNRCLIDQFVKQLVTKTHKKLKNYFILTVIL